VPTIAGEVFLYAGIPATLAPDMLLQKGYRHPR